MVHIDIKEETKQQLNEIRGILQQLSPKAITSYDKVVSKLCYMYLKKLNREEKNKNGSRKKHI